MNYEKELAQKTVSADTAVQIIKSGDWVDYGWCTGTPDILDKALARRTDELTKINLRGGILLKPLAIFEREDAGEHFTWNSWHMGGIERQLIERGCAYYSPIRYSELPRYYEEMEHPTDVIMLQVAPMDENGFFNFGPNASHLLAACKHAKQIILEVNHNMPRCLGSSQNGISISQVTYVVEGEDPPISQLTSPPPTEVDKSVAHLVVEQIPNGSCLQLGIGGMPNAIGSLIADSNLKDLRVHTEMYVDAFVDIAKAGKIVGKQTYAFGAGTQKLYDYLNNNPDLSCAPVDYTNHIANIAAIDRFISINNCVEIDLFGQVASETAGLRHISGAGGQLDFVLGAYLSHRGKSFLCCSSTYEDKNGVLHSRILPTLSPGAVVTATRANVQYVATEYGIVNLKGLTSWQRAQSLISIAHPSFRGHLIAEANKMKIWLA